MTIGLVKELGAIEVRAAVEGTEEVRVEGESVVGTTSGTIAAG